jgi:cAMP-dependent protein kinase regulator
MEATDDAWTLKKYDHFIRGLHKPPGTRTDLEIAAMADELSVTSSQSNSFLSRFEVSGQLIELCKVIEVKLFQHNQTVFEQGDEGDCFYIIHSGSVSVYVNSQSVSVEASQNIKVAEYRKGQSFGDLSLLYSQPRAATVITMEPTELICLSKEPFDAVVKELQQKQIGVAYAVISAVPLLETVPSESTLHLARICFMKKFTQGQVIEAEGCMPQGIYVLQKGKIKLTRSIKFRTAAARTIDELSKEPLEDEERTVKEVTIDELSNGQVICDYAVLNNRPLQYSVVCVMPSYAYFIERKNITTMHSVSSMQDALWEMKQHSKPYPDDIAIRKMFFEARRWSLYRRKVVKEVMLDKMHKRL